MKRSVAIVGGGIAGLSTAWYLPVDTDIMVFERDDQWGGKIQTRTVDGCTLDVGPEAVLAQKPDFRDLCRELGIEGDLIGTNPANKRVYLYDRGGLQVLPEGMTMLVPTRVAPFLRSSLVSPLGKLRMGLEWFIPPRLDEADESVGDFIRRRFGQEALRRLAQPIIGSIFSCDVNRLSLKAALPMLRAMEQQKGSLLRSMLFSKRPPSSASAFLSLRYGLGQVIDRLTDALRERQVDLRRSTPLTGLDRDGEGWILHVGNGVDVRADAVVLAVPAPQAADLLRTVDARLSASLRQIRYGQSTTVCLAWPRDAVSRPLDGTGFVVSPDAGRKLTACTWTTSKWAGRAPDTHVLLRASLSRTSDDPVAVATEELRSILGIRGTPDLAVATRFDPGTPAYEVDHLERVSALEAAVARHPGLYLTGAAYRGSGIPDCIRQAKETAAAVQAACKLELAAVM